MDTEPCSYGDCIVDFFSVEWDGHSDLIGCHETAEIQHWFHSLILLESLNVVSDVEGFEEANPKTGASATPCLSDLQV